jgi:hypothetical protein
MINLGKLLLLKISGSDGRIYFGQDEITNSGVVGIDTADNGFLKIAPQLQDVPAIDIVLGGQNFKWANPLTAEKNATATTGAFSTFGKSTHKGEIIKGNVKCSACVMSVKIVPGTNSNVADLRVVSWGLGSPYGLAFDREQAHYC